MVDYYPIMLSLKGKKCVVAGGGKVAERKVRGLLDGGADTVVVVSPRATMELELLAEAGSIQLLRREYKEEDADGAFLLIAATDSREANRAAVEVGKKAGALVNAADEADDGGFVTPAVVRRGDLILAVTTGGASPAMTSLIAQELGERFGAEYARRLARLRQLRDKLIAEMPDQAQRRAILRLAAAESEARSAEETDANLEPDESIEKWMKRLLLAAGGRQL